MIEESSRHLPCLHDHICSRGPHDLSIHAEKKLFDNHQLSDVILCDAKSLNKKYRYPDQLYSTNRFDVDRLNSVTG